MTTRSPNRSSIRSKTELIADRVWRTNTQLELAIVEYVAWFNTRRLHSSLGNIPPIEHEQAYAAAQLTDAVCTPTAKRAGVPEI